MLVYFSVVDFTLNNEEKKSSNFIDFLFLKKYFFFQIIIWAFRPIHLSTCLMDRIRT